jgi:hypothetical protein
VNQLCSAVLAAHGYDNPKAKWRLPQARVFGDWLRALEKCRPTAI